MEIPVVVAPHDGGYRAWCRHPVAAEAVGASAFEARSRLEATLRAAVGGDIETLPLEAGPGREWVASAGWLPDDEATAVWRDGLAEYRRQCEPPAPVDGLPALAVPLPAPTEAVS